MTNNKGDEKAKEPKDLSPKPPYPLSPAEQELKDAEKATNDWIKQVLDEQYREKTLKLQRASAFKTDKYTHALDLIIERAKHHKSPSICIDLKELIFENTSDDVKTLMGWFEEIESFGGFKHHKKQNYTRGVRFYISGTNIENLINYRQKVKKAGEGNQESLITKTEITKMPEVRVKGLEEMVRAKKKDDKPKFPYKLPAGTTWGNFTIKFLNDENILIQVKQFKHNTNYKKMGFVGKGKNPNPSEAWAFLRVLSKLNGELTITDKEAKDRYKKQKELLAKSLQNYFSIDYDPFYPYRSSSEKSDNSYKIKITLIPPPDTKGKTDTDSGDDKDNLGIKEYLDEQNPQIYEDK